MEEIAIATVMTTDIDVVEPGHSLVSILDRMRNEHLSCVPVVENGRPVGVISERDVVCALAGQLHGDLLPATAKELMSGPPITISESASVESGIRLQEDRGIRRLLVVDRDGRLVGVLIQSNLVEAQTQALRGERDRLEARVDDRTEQLRLANERLEHMALVDPMLGTGNRRAMDQHLTRLQGLSERFGHGFGVVMFDIDEFKKFNDRYGHPEADEALADVARAAQSAICPGDILFRFGGEEFVVTLPKTSEAGALAAAERIRGAVEALQIPHESSGHGVVTVSLGVSIVGPETGNVDLSNVIRAADDSLYQAKQAGRNRAGAVIGPEMEGSG